MDPNADREYADKYEAWLDYEAEMRLAEAEADEALIEEDDWEADQREQYFRGVDRRRRLKIAALVLSVLIVAVVGAIWIAIASTTAAPSSASREGAAGGTGHQVAATGTLLPPPTLTAAQIAALPEARYNATIPGLIPANLTSTTPAMETTYTIEKDIALYGPDLTTPVARLARANFLGIPTVVIETQTVGPWALILTPARQYLPSAHDHQAAAQTSAWVQASLLHKNQVLEHRIVVSTGKQTLTIVQFDGGNPIVFSAGIGTAATPTPTGITGYLQARYLDPGQGQSKYPIGLTSLHSAAADEPYGGHDGGLIGVHFNTTATGAESHGCIRLAPAGITAVNTLPLGTPITITN